MKSELFLRGAGLVAAVAVLVWLAVRTLRRTQDDRLILKWIVTALVILFFVKVAGPTITKMGPTGVAGFLMALVGGLVLAIVWVPNIAAMFARPFTILYDGGEQPAEPKPFYSVAQARRKQGRYQEALAEVQKQLEMFPNDYEGMLLQAEIQALDLHDLRAAEAILQQICQLPERDPRHVVGALSLLADWRLRLSQDAEGARQALQQIVDLFPDSEPALVARQRMAHLGDPEQLAASHERTLVASMGNLNVGLLRDTSHLKPVETDPATLAGEYVKHLELHPDDTEIREKLALIHAAHYQRPDLATIELNQLIQQPNQPPKRVVHWLNLVADLHIKHGDYERARGSLQTIVDKYPGLAAAENAQRRLDILKLEFKTKETSQAVKLGSYEQNIGLKSRRLPEA